MNIYLYNMNFKRSGNKWSVNEVLSLQREYELLEMSIQEIALKHSRSVEAILYKLEAEDIIDTWYHARGYNVNFNKNDDYEDSDEEEEQDLDDQDSDEEQDCNEEEQEQEFDEDYDDNNVSDDESDDDDEIVNLTRRVGFIENTVNEIKNMVTNFLYSQNKSIKSSSSVDYIN